MAELPTGTVTLLFTDVEGSTVLLSRLGPAYADAVDGQRRLQRRAWAEHGGTEMGTEGDSFFVVFPTAPAAVAAATQAQRELSTYPWPRGERVRVRMGIHTGNPAVHDGGYVGMDVHRAARIAGAAHGGQVVVSAATAELVGSSLSVGLRLLDLGSHHLKNIASAEHLFQLVVDGLQGDFPALKTLGAASSLPVPATVLVGRDGELAELAAVLRAPGVRLVTLTGPGGSGKTRLAIGLAQSLVEMFPDGVYFVPLAAVTSSDVMWTAIAEVLDVPPEGRTTPAFFSHVAHRSSLFVLDNLEQLVGADSVVAELLTHAPQVVVIATSRRPLHVPAEHEHPVPPLELPDDAGLDAAHRSGAVQLFVQHAKMVKPSFALTETNAADVTEACQRLDGLPLAIELASARTKLLSPHALLVRLDNVLDIAATGSQSPSRQKTLRDTIAWSYDLLTLDEQRFFRRLGVFAGGADLDAITAVAADHDAVNGGTLELVAALVDASLVTVAETIDGEPRIDTLETVHVYLIERLTAAGELPAARKQHAHYFLKVAQELRPRLDGEHYLAARELFETERDNFREAISWALQTDSGVSTSSGDVQIGLRLCIALSGFWSAGGYFSEGWGWLERAITSAGDRESADVARCLSLAASHLRASGLLDRAHERASQSVGLWRRLDDKSKMPHALIMLADLEYGRGQTATARRLYEEAMAVARADGDDVQLEGVLGETASFEADEGNYQASLDLATEALSIAHDLGDPPAVVTFEYGIASTLHLMGRTRDAARRMHDLMPAALQLGEPGLAMALAEGYAAVLADLGQHRLAVVLVGSCDALAERLGTLRGPKDQAQVDTAMASARVSLSANEWNGAYRTGQHTAIEDALSAAYEAGRPNGSS